MSAPEIRDYQRGVIAQFWANVEAGRRRILLVAPTGSGKTVIAGDIVRTQAEARKSILFLAHRREIITQTSQKLHAIDIPHGTIQAGIRARPFENVQIASIQTLW